MTRYRSSTGALFQTELPTLPEVVVETLARWRCALTPVPDDVGYVTRRPGRDPKVWVYEAQYGCGSISASVPVAGHDRLPEAQRDIRYYRSSTGVTFKSALSWVPRSVVENFSQHEWPEIPEIVRTRSNTHWIYQAFGGDCVSWVYLPYRGHSKLEPAPENVASSLAGMLWDEIAENLRLADAMKKAEAVKARACGLVPEPTDPWDPPGLSEYRQRQRAPEQKPAGTYHGRPCLYWSLDQRRDTGPVLEAIRGGRCLIVARADTPSPIEIWSVSGTQPPIVARVGQTLIRYLDGARELEIVEFDLVKDLVNPKPAVTPSSSEVDILHAAVTRLEDVNRGLAKANRELVFQQGMDRSCYEESCRRKDARIQELEAENRQLKHELELERMRLAGVSAVLLANSRSSRDAARQMHPDYMSATTQDAMRAVDREIEHREAKVRAEAENRQLKDDVQRWHKACDQYRTHELELIDEVARLKAAIKDAGAGVAVPCHQPEADGCRAALAKLRAELDGKARACGEAATRVVAAESRVRWLEARVQELEAVDKIWREENHKLDLLLVDANRKIKELEAKTAPKKGRSK